MNILLDTHIALWAISAPSKLDGSVREMLEDSENSVYYSLASVWEIAIKHQLNNGNMPISEEEFVSLCDASGLICLDIRPEHIYCVKSLKRPSSAPKHHDPFDRLLIAQAKIEEMRFITHDHLLKDYNEKCIYSV